MKDKTEQCQEPRFRYRVGYSKFYRGFISILVGVIMVFSGWVGADFILEEQDFSSLIWILMIEVFCVWALLATYSYIAVYKGTAVVNRILWKKEYPLSAFGEPEEDAVPVYKGHGYLWAPIYVFYGDKGKKLFKIYQGMENSEKFYKEIKHRYSQVWQNNHIKEKNHGNQKHQRNR